MLSLIHIFNTFTYPTRPLDLNLFELHSNPMSMSTTVSVFIFLFTFLKWFSSLSPDAIDSSTLICMSRVLYVMIVYAFVSVWAVQPLDNKHYFQNTQPPVHSWCSDSIESVVHQIWDYIILALQTCCRLIKHSWACELLFQQAGVYLHKMKNYFAYFSDSHCL